VVKVRTVTPEGDFDPDGFDTELDARQGATVHTIGRRIITGRALDAAVPPL